MGKLSRGFYERDTLIVARELLGKILVSETCGSRISCMISEVEAYTGVADRACHAYGGKKTKRTMPLWGEAGHSYIYFIYGMYYMLNVVTQLEGEPCAVLIRGVIPIEPMDLISQMRYDKTFERLNKRQIRNLANGPGKVCDMLGLDLSHNQVDLLGDTLYVLDAPLIEDERILNSKRINIDYAGEAKDYLYRYYIKDYEEICYGKQKGTC